MQDALGLTRCVLWGHSDGAVIAAILALRQPERYRGIILEALHLDREKPRSREFFRGMAQDPDGLGEGVTRKLAAEHGAGYWRTLIRAGGQAWLDIAATPEDDFFQHRLAELAVPALVLHGRHDPRTEPGELDRIRPFARVEILEDAGHSPHSERSSAVRCTDVVREFLGSLSPAGQRGPLSCPVDLEIADGRDGADASPPGNQAGPRPSRYRPGHAPIGEGLSRRRVLPRGQAASCAKDPAIGPAPRG